MGSANQEEKVFEAKDASNMVEELRASFVSGKTRSYEWRASQLRSVVKIINAHEQDIIQALRSDLSKPELEAYIQETLIDDASRKAGSRRVEGRNDISGFHAHSHRVAEYSLGVASQKKTFGLKRQTIVTFQS
ncbi:Succinylglutamate-semialdehyde dehydrogenase [Parasponia andersonii]|uniref:Succinylglutamate-semialdehyde dehydrogenase n=1 Tax=Parasponia andersonii TaxID=3476 RepID=A0A2P5DIR4_PARAD|nr:Succinylglutamate-semialdehyde dehydrogenase [Parasponia andersonii]